MIEKYVHGQLESTSICAIHEHPFLYLLTVTIHLGQEPLGFLVERADEGVSMLFSFSEVFLKSGENAPDFVVCQANEVVVNVQSSELLN